MCSESAKLFCESNKIKPLPSPSPLLLKLFYFTTSAKLYRDCILNFAIDATDGFLHKEMFCSWNCCRNNAEISVFGALLHSFALSIRNTRNSMWWVDFSIGKSVLWFRSNVQRAQCLTVLHVSIAKGFSSLSGSIDTRSPWHHPMRMLRWICAWNQTHDVQPNTKYGYNNIILWLVQLGLLNHIYLFSTYTIRAKQSHRTNVKPQQTKIRLAP